MIDILRQNSLPPFAGALANEIEERGLKFADTALGTYEMLSKDEMDLILKLLRGHYEN